MTAMKRQQLLVYLMMAGLLLGCFFAQPIPADQIEIIETTITGNYVVLDKLGNTLQNVEPTYIYMECQGNLIGGGIKSSPLPDTVVTVKASELTIGKNNTYTVKVKLSNAYRYMFWSNGMRSNDEFFSFDKKSIREIFIGKENTLELVFRKINSILNFDYHEKDNKILLQILT
jgi:hypothetical protein